MDLASEIWDYRTDTVVLKLLVTFSVWCRSIPKGAMNYTHWQ